jgi:GNAT superfamily N-acetyltransferase
MLGIRAARTGELERRREIELDAGGAFAEIGMREIAGHEPPQALELQDFVTAGRAWVAARADDAPVAYLLTTIVDGNSHIEQVSVVRASRRQGIGAGLIDHVSANAAREHRRWVTLTTFRDVPWNAPYYRRLGFAPIRPRDQGRELSDLIQVETARIPGSYPRVAMRRATG